MILNFRGRFMFNSMLYIFGYNKDWQDWQEKQPQAFFDHSPIFDYYKNNSKSPWNIEEMEFSVLSQKSLSETEIYYKYAFGDFSPFFFPNYCNVDIFAFFGILLDLYDVCKGYSRYIFGDNEAISSLRKLYTSKDNALVAKYDFSQHVYNYNIIHAHTVAYFSLSTLIMTIASNFIGRKVTSNPQYHITISFEYCKAAFDEELFGIPRNKISPRTSPIPINGKQKFINCSRSLPIVKQSKCSKCFRLSEGTWGKFHCCLDCHLKKICSSCGADAQGRSASDDMPKCSFHIKMEEYK